MIKKEHVLKLKEAVKEGRKGLSLTASLLLDIAVGEKFSNDFYKDRKISLALGGLRRYKFVRHIKESNSYALTAKGEKKLRYIVIDDIQPRSQKHWNGKWFLVMYDLPIRFKNARNAFRWKLKDLGFFQFQKSAWIYPYPCESEIIFVADFFGVRKHVEVLEINKISNDKILRDHFGLQ
jgi:DNA-binding transcriptional regulator PaaX